MVVLSYDKLVAQLDCSTPEDGTKAIVEDIAKVEGVVQTNVIAVVKPQHCDQSRSRRPLTPFMLGAMDAAEDGVGVLHAMADDAAAAMRADRRERGDGAFE